MIKLYKLYVQPVLQYGVLIYGCAGKSELKQLKWSQNHIIRIIVGLKKFSGVRDVREKYKLLTLIELHLYELLKLMSKSLRQSSEKTKNRKNHEVDDVSTKKLLCTEQENCLIF